MMSFTFVVAVLMVGTLNGVVLLEWFNGSGPSVTRRTRIVVPGRREPWRLLPPVAAFVVLRVSIPSILKTLATRKREKALRDAEPGEVDSGE